DTELKEIGMSNGPEPTPEPVAVAAPAESSLAVPTTEEKNWAMFVHLSALISLVVLGGLTFVGPLVIWLIKKDQSKFIDWHGKEALNFILIEFIASVICVIGSNVTCGFGALIFVPILIAIVVYSIVIWIIAAMKANNGEYYRYPYVPRLLN